MPVSHEELRKEKVPIAFRDYCAHLLIPLNKCRHVRENKKKSRKNNTQETNNDNFNFLFELFFLKKNNDKPSNRL